MQLIELREHEKGEALNRYGTKRQTVSTADYTELLCVIHYIFDVFMICLPSLLISGRWDVHHQAHSSVTTP